MLSTVKKDKKRRSLVKKYQIKNLYAKVFQQDLLLKSILERKSSSFAEVNLIDSLSYNSLKRRVDGLEGVMGNSFDKQKLALYCFINESKDFLKRQLLEKAFESVPRNSSKTRVKNRCIKSGRSRAVLKFCKLSRICLREQASKGEIPGVSKASW